MVEKEYKPCVLRISFAARCLKRELKKMQWNPSADFKCLPLTSNPYEWQFAIRGPNGTDFKDGIYHGRLQFSEEYPNKLPTLTLLTENGRFKTQTEISLCDIWSWSIGEFSVQGALLKLIDTLPTYPDGALGSVEYDKKKIRALAIKSREAAPRYGTAERQKLIDKIHEYMLRVTSNGGGISG
ncbi:ubiquitin-conjugating enzyme E2 32-like isoform X1 [Prunus yedoensis var. nudiflora]|uniref:Ubiquitin-conjugating enzyme E2 32-like isoform X1 n=1 Tax=Prunus yedoensis var. nudiflora TaxID=2094558 RepID=A0A314UC72_PRUYE|nr:ubiquitin-conjugating enzyme E2 32-like isoform X1 [Prunus yedoensis var. nudiflora]